MFFFSLTNFRFGCQEQSTLGSGAVSFLSARCEHHWGGWVVQGRSTNAIIGQRGADEVEATILRSTRGRIARFLREIHQIVWQKELPEHSYTSQTGMHSSNYILWVRAYVQCVETSEQLHALHNGERAPHSTSADAYSLWYVCGYRWICSFICWNIPQKNATEKFIVWIDVWINLYALSINLVIIDFDFSLLCHTDSLYWFP